MTYKLKLFLVIKKKKFINIKSFKNYVFLFIFYFLFFMIYLYWTSHFFTLN